MRTDELKAELVEALADDAELFTHGRDRWAELVVEKVDRLVNRRIDEAINSLQENGYIPT